MFGGTLSVMDGFNRHGKSIVRLSLIITLSEQS
jgi:hypothetical protein